MVDGPVEIYSAQVWSDYLAITDGRDGWQQLLLEYGVDVLVLSREEQPRLIDPGAVLPLPIGKRPPPLPDWGAQRPGWVME